MSSNSLASPRLSCVLASIFSVMSASASADEVASVDYRSIAEHLVERLSHSESGIVDYREYRFRTSSESFDALAELLFQSQDQMSGEVAGQRLSGRQEGESVTIVFRNHYGDEDWSAVSYSFRTDLEYGPSEVRSYDNSGSDMRLVYGYKSSEPGVLVRPSIAAKAEIRGNDEVDVILWIVDQWRDDCAASDVALSLPPLYLEISFLQSDQLPEASVREPQYLSQSSGCDKLALAIAEVAAKLGTTDPGADFSFDGLVDVDDMEKAFLLMGGHTN